MKKIILATAIILTTASVAMADASNGIPSPYENARRTANPITGNVNGWLARRLFIPQFIVEPGSVRTRKYGTSVGHCKPVTRGFGKIGRWLGASHVTRCR